jgi:hypothetical protein
MKFLPGNCYFVYNQGNNHEPLFKMEKHYMKFLELFKSYIVPYCEVLCWSLVPGHFRFLLYTDKRVIGLVKQGLLMLDPVTNGFRKLLSGYAHEFNGENNRYGALFRPKTKSKQIFTGDRERQTNSPNGDDFSECFQYIHNSPVAAGLARDPADWKWSSYRFYTGQRRNSFCNKDLANRFMAIQQKT